ncbi:MAG: DNRLRE domain-containing protein, partial [Anaerolineales bacterium]|nr:DNRLRE domain-containing protein [Anaerolineales bacterium]
TYVRSGIYEDNNYGLLSDLIIKGSSGNYERRTYMKFDLDGLPQNTPIYGATLNLFVTRVEFEPSSVPLNAFSAASDNWGEQTLTWSNKPGVDNFLNLDTVSSSGQWVSFDVLSYVQQEMDGDQLASFVLLDGSGADTRIKFASREAEENRPYLSINACTPTATPTPTASNTPTHTPTFTPSPTSTPTFTPSPTTTNVPGVTPTNTPTPTATPKSLCFGGIHVAPNGSDSSGNGGYTTPYQTLAKAVEQAQAGSQICLREGVYPAVNVTLDKSGTAAQPLIIQAYPGEAAVLDGGNNTSSCTTDNILNVTNAAYVEILDLELRNSGGQGIQLLNTANITVRNNRLHHICQRGIGGSGDNLTIENNEVWQAVQENTNEALLSIGGWSPGIGTERHSNNAPSKNVVIRNNYVHDMWGEGIEVQSADGAVVSGNIVHDTYSVNIYIDNTRNVTLDGNLMYALTHTYDRSTHGYPAQGISMANESISAVSNTPLQNIIIRNNIMSGTGRGISYFHDMSNPNPNNTYRDIYILHNVIKDTYDASLRAFSVETEFGYLAPSNIIVRNNILYEAVNGRALNINNETAWTFSHNNWPDGVPEEAAEPNSFAAEPNLVAPDVGATAIGFQPMEGSVLFGKGIPQSQATTDYKGLARSTTAPTIGAFENPFIPGLTLYMPVLMNR